MKILVNDYSGHPFQVQLSRSLASRGLEVLHITNISFQTPKGNLVKQAEDPQQFDIKGIALSKPFKKYSYIARIRQEREYGYLMMKEIEKFKPDIFISSNTPVDAQALIQRYCRKEGIPFIFWLQDIYGIAITKILSNKLGLFGKMLGIYYLAREKVQLRRSEAVVSITEDFSSYLTQWGIAEENIHVIPNWAPIEELPARPRENDWTMEQGLGGKIILLYSGTLGMKHNPESLKDLALHFEDDHRIRIVVISEGIGADYLKEKKRELALENLLILDFQPFERLPEVLSSADVLLTILESDAGVFSVPSKVLSYLCAGRSLLMLGPLENMAFRTVVDEEAGIAISSEDIGGFLKSAEILVSDAEMRHRLGRNARAYAERIFDIDKISDKFITVIENVL